LEKFEENYLLLLKQNGEKEKLIKIQDTDIKKLNSLLQDHIFTNEKNILKESNKYKDEISKLTEEVFQLKELNESLKFNENVKNSLKDENLQLQKENNELECKIKNFDLKILDNEKNEKFWENFQKELENKIYFLKDENDKKEASINKLVKELMEISQEKSNKNELLKNEKIWKIENDKLLAKIDLLSQQILDQENKIIQEDDKNSTIITSYKNKEILHTTNLNFLKDSLVKLYDTTNKIFILFEKKYKNKIASLKDKINKLSKTIKELVCDKNKEIEKLSQNLQSQNLSSNEKLNSEYKLNIDRLELEKTKLIFQIQNLERYVKENQSRTEERKKTTSSRSSNSLNILHGNGNENDLKSNQTNLNENNISKITILNTKVDWLQKEYNKFQQILEPQYKEEINKEKEKNLSYYNKLKEIELKLNQFKIENAGKSKIIEERNEEVRLLKEQLQLNK
jgi:hypothetical protein